MVVYSYMVLWVSGNQQFIPFLYNVYTPHGHWSALIVILSDTVIKVSAVWYHWSCIMLFETYCASIWKPCRRACPWWNTCCHDGRGSFWSSRSKYSVRVHFNVHTFTQLCVPVDFCTVYHFLACLSFVFAFPPLLVPTFCNQLPKFTDLWMFYDVMCTVTQAKVQSAHSFFNKFITKELDWSTNGLYNPRWICHLSHKIVSKWILLHQKHCGFVPSESKAEFQHPYCRGFQKCKFYNHS